MFKQYSSQQLKLILDQEEILLRSRKFDSETERLHWLGVMYTLLHQEMLVDYNTTTRVEIDEDIKNLALETFCKVSSIRNIYSLLYQSATNINTCSSKPFIKQEKLRPYLSEYRYELLTQLLKFECPESHTSLRFKEISMYDFYNIE